MLFLKSDIFIIRKILPLVKKFLSLFGYCCVGAAEMAGKEAYCFARREGWEVWARSSNNPTRFLRDQRLRIAAEERIGSGRMGQGSRKTNLCLYLALKITSTIDKTHRLHSRYSNDSRHSCSLVRPFGSGPFCIDQDLSAAGCFIRENSRTFSANIKKCPAHLAGHSGKHPV